VMKENKFDNILSRCNVIISVTAINFILPSNLNTECEFEFTKNSRRTEYQFANYRTSLIRILINQKIFKLD
jgi:hypothetical protein